MANLFGKNVAKEKKCGTLLMGKQEYPNNDAPSAVTAQVKQVASRACNIGLKPAKRSKIILLPLLLSYRQSLKCRMSTSHKVGNCLSKNEGQLDV